jgi:hypothetical protein
MTFVQTQVEMVLCIVYTPRAIFRVGAVSPPTLLMTLDLFHHVTLASFGFSRQLLHYQNCLTQTREEDEGPVGLFYIMVLR